MFFKDNEISYTKDRQDEDVFIDLIIDKKDAAACSGLKSAINIADFAPKQIVANFENAKTRRERLRRMKNEEAQGSSFGAGFDRLNLDDGGILMSDSSMPGSSLRMKEEEGRKGVPTQGELIKRLEVEQLNLEIADLIEAKAKNSPPRDPKSKNCGARRKELIDM